MKVKYLKVKGISKGYTDYKLNLVDLETMKVIAIIETGSIEHDDLYQIVSRMVRLMSNSDFIVTFDLEELNKK